MIDNQHTCSHAEILSFCSIRPPKQIENVKRVTTYPAFPYRRAVQLMVGLLTYELKVVVLVVELMVGLLTYELKVVVLVVGSMVGL